MILYELLNKLKENNFIKEECSVDLIEGVLLFVNKDTDYRVLVKEVIYSDDIESIIKNSQNIKNIWTREGINVWNTYLIMYQANEDSISIEQAYMAERSNKGFRKYFLLSKYDLDRIPFFLMHKVSNKKSFEFKKKIFNNDCFISKEIYSIFKRKRFFSEELTEDQIKALVNIAIKEGE